MKKTITVLTAAVLLLTSSAFAADKTPDLNHSVKTAFQKDFSRAVNVSWTSKEEFYFAEFTLNNRKISAAYNEEGVLIATSRTVAFDEVPMSVSQSVHERYPGYKVAGTVTEITLEKQPAYYLVIADSKQVLHLKATASGELTVEKKTKI